MSASESIRQEIADIERTRAAHKAQLDPLVQGAVINGLSAIAALFLGLGGLAMALTGHWWVANPMDAGARLLVGAAGAGLIGLAIWLWARQFRYPAAILRIPGYSREDFARLAELKRRLRETA